MKLIFHRYGEIMVTGSLFIVSLLLLLFTDQIIKVSAARVASEQLGPKFWPKLLLLGIVILTLVQLVKTIVESLRKDRDEQGEQAYIRQLTDVRLVSMIALIFVYIVLLPQLGFILLTPVLLLFISWLVGVRPWWKNLLSTVVITAALIFVFGHFLQIPLPRGTGLLREISFFLY
ncbi:putative tricarboxylic transport membrane protein [Caldalkalibacillus uzonensis]|uniref:Tricarboxylic transport membrane protein n=1 Tax=Caldalkalibacillus uzonensis TaxID=353224 RepID=A0ABU0CQ34_9BACI|nr:tripartite tricarboxylate transporter TctB family protein [Caldalkalibacillus uzonensis]MDQ0338208.1 putative tricarboxylic transport membrane protein [Caldalkalibacillus uzonensis]